MVSLSPHCSLVHPEVILSSHCLWLVIPSTVRMQRWWKAFSCLRCFLTWDRALATIQQPDRTQAWYTCLLVVIDKLALVNTARHRAPKALLEALATRLPYSGFISWEKIFENFADLFLFAKILFANILHERAVPSGTR